MLTDTSQMGCQTATFPTPLPGSRDATRSKVRTLSVDIESQLPGLLRVVDLASITALGLVTAWFLPPTKDVSLSCALAIVLGATAMVNVLQLARAYSMESIGRFPVQLTKLAIGWSAACCGVLALSVAVAEAEAFDARWAASWFGSSLLVLAVARWFASNRLQRWRSEGRSIRNIAVLGTGNQAVALARRLNEQAARVRVLGVFIEGDRLAGIFDAAGDSEHLVALAKARKVDEVVVALPWNSPGALNHILAKFAPFQVEVKIDPGIPEIDFAPTHLTLLAGVPTLTVQGRPLAGWGAILKRLEDVVLASILIVFLAPLLFAIAFLIKIDSRGPVLFRQERSGFDNRRIRVFKFRSMHHEPSPDPNVPQARRNDPRVTQLGGFLRRSSLDELPQLLNVLRGEMSLVGPRPHASVHNEKYAVLIEGYLGRHRIKPGITGWAQVNGMRGGIESIEEMKRRLEYDRFYIANWSLLLDIKILLMTVPTILRGTNAY